MMKVMFAYMQDVAISKYTCTLIAIVTFLPKVKPSHADKTIVMCFPEGRPRGKYQRLQVNNRDKKKIKISRKIQTASFFPWQQVSP